MKAITLTRGLVALVDDEDFEELSRFKWYAQRHDNTFYAKHTLSKTETANKRTIYMHRIICPDFKLVDHINRNGLDNRKENLRSATGTQSQGNKDKHRSSTSKFRGVSWDKVNCKWKAAIKDGSKSRHLGRFETEREAAQAYDAAARAYFGEFARLNLGPTK